MHYLVPLPFSQCKMCKSGASKPPGSKIKCLSDASHRGTAGSRTASLTRQTTWALNRKGRQSFTITFINSEADLHLFHFTRCRKLKAQIRTIGPGAPDSPGAPASPWRKRKSPRWASLYWIQHTAAVDDNIDDGCINGATMAADLGPNSSSLSLWAIKTWVTLQRERRVGEIRSTFITSSLEAATVMSRAEY